MKRLAMAFLFFFSIAVLPAGASRAVLGYSESDESSLVWGHMKSPTANTLWDIWGTSADDIFAVGLEGTIIHNNGSGWRVMESNSASHLQGVWGSSSTDVFAVGSSTILHYDGSAWSLVYSGDEWFKPNLLGVWGSSSTNVFAVGGSGTILHYDGSDWRVMESNSASNLRGVWGSSSTDVFAVGSGDTVGSGGTILHYDGSTWSAMDSGTTSRLTGIWGISATDVFAVGASTILHYDGNIWSPMTVNTWASFSDVWGSSASDIYAVGRSESPIQHYDGNTWSPLPGNIGDSLLGVWGSSSTDVFAVGNTLLLATGKPTILHYGEWDPPVIWVTPIREWFESVTDFVEAVGKSKTHWAFYFACDPLIAAELDMTITNKHPAFSCTPDMCTNIHVSCGGTGDRRFTFSPTEPGLITDTITISSDIETVSFNLIGNAVPVETPEYWIADLPDILAWQLTYDESRGYLYITDSVGNRLLVFSPELREIVKEIPVGNYPVGMAMTSDGNRLLVANSGEYSISEIDLETMTELRKIPLPSQMPLPGYTPWDIVVVSEKLALFGTLPPGAASGGPIYQLDLETDQVLPRDDIGLGAAPVLRTSRDFSTTAIVLDPRASPTHVARYDTATDSSIVAPFGMELGEAINKNGTQIVITTTMDDEDDPDMHLVDRDLNTVIRIKLKHIPYGVDFHPTGKYIYATGGKGGWETCIQEVSLDTLTQTRHLDYAMPEDIIPVRHPKTLVVSGDGLWVYALLRRGVNTPPSKLLAVKIDRPVVHKRAMPWIPLLLLED